MTYREAIKHLKYEREAQQRREPYAILVVEAFDTAIMALEKQVPKKVTHEATKLKCCTCPNCKSVVDDFTEFAGQKVRVTTDYCTFCGQVLDWE